MSTTINLNGQKVELTKDICNNLLKFYIEKAYKESGVFSLQSGADLYEQLNLLLNDPLDSDKLKDIYMNFCKTLEIANSKCVFTLEEASIISKIVLFINTNILVNQSK